jgi:hypothetical protein
MMSSITSISVNILNIVKGRFLRGDILHRSLERMSSE